MKRYAVLTGDLVESRKLSPDGKEAAQFALKRIAQAFARVHPGAVVGNLDIFRGDSWQLCLEESERVLEAALFIRSGLKAESALLGEKLDARIGLAVGEVEGLKDSKISESSGPAFELSGSALDEIADAKVRMLLKIQNQSGPLARLSDAIVRLVDLHATRWSVSEAIAIHGALSGLTQEETSRLPQAALADGSAPTQQAIAAALARTRWKTYLLPAIESFAAALREKEKC